MQLFAPVTRFHSPGQDSLALLHVKCQTIMGLMQLARGENPKPSIIPTGRRFQDPDQDIYARFRVLWP